jgi:hypothetical protein
MLHCVLMQGDPATQHDADGAAHRVLIMDDIVAQHVAKANSTQGAARRTLSRSMSPKLVASFTGELQNSYNTNFVAQHVAGLLLQLRGAEAEARVVLLRQHHRPHAVAHLEDLLRAQGRVRTSAAVRAFALQVPHAGAMHFANLRACVFCCPTNPRPGATLAPLGGELHTGR